MKTIRFAYRADGSRDGYYCSEPGERSGEYVPADVARQLLASVREMFALAVMPGQFTEAARQEILNRARAARTAAEDK